MNKKTSLILLVIALVAIVLAVVGALYVNKMQMQGRPENNVAQPTVRGNELPTENATSTYPAEPKMIKPKASPWQPPAHTPNNS